MNPDKLVAVWLSGLAVLLERRYDGFALIPAGRLVGEVLELGPRGFAKRPADTQGMGYEAASDSGAAALIPPSVRHRGRKWPDAESRAVLPDSLELGPRRRVS